MGERPGALEQLAYTLGGANVPSSTYRIQLGSACRFADVEALVPYLASLGVGFAIITESSLSFIGLGAQPPTPTWGSMVQTGFQYLEIAPWFVMAPAMMIFLSVLGFNLLGDGLRDALDPTMKIQP